MHSAVAGAAAVTEAEDARRRSEQPASTAPPGGGAEMSKAEMSKLADRVLSKGAAAASSLMARWSNSARSSRKGASEVPTAPSFREEDVASWHKDCTLSGSALLIEGLYVLKIKRVRAGGLEDQTVVVHPDFVVFLVGGPDA